MSDNTDESDTEDESDDEIIPEVMVKDRPMMQPVVPSAQIYSCSSTKYSRSLAADVKFAASKTNRVHGLSSTGTPWLFARKIKALKQHNKQFLAWCKNWINDVYKMEAKFIKVKPSEPHIVSYDHKKTIKKKKKKEKKSGKKAFDGIGTHQDGSYCTIIMSCSHTDEYVGGGTFFPHLDLTVRLGEGEVLLFQGVEGPYSAPHRAQPISSGKRLLYLAFFKLRKQKKKKGEKKKKKKKEKGITIRKKKKKKKKKNI